MCEQMTQRCKDGVGDEFFPLRYGFVGVFFSYIIVYKVFLECGCLFNQVIIWSSVVSMAVLDKKA